MHGHGGAIVTEIGERDRGCHASLDIGLEPDQLVGWVDLDEHAVHRVLGSVGIVDHDGVEDAAGLRVDRDVLDRRANTDRSPEVGEVFWSDHALENQLAWRIERAAESDLTKF